MADDPNFPIATASISWFDSSHQLHIRVYSVDGYNVVERCNDGQGWTTGSLAVPAANVSATTWADSAGQHIRVYATAGNVTTEWCNDPGTTGWTKGSYTQP